MSNATIRNCGILNCNFTKVKLNNAICWKNNFMFSAFDKANLIGADIRTSDLTGCDFSVAVNYSSAKAGLAKAGLQNNQLYRENYYIPLK